MDNNEKVLIRIDDHLVSIDILGTNDDGTLAIEYNVIHKDPEKKIDHDEIQRQLPILINKIVSDYIDKIDSEPTA